MSQLYSLNTAGAVLVAALTGFAFIPYWGLDGSIYIAFAQSDDCNGGVDRRPHLDIAGPRNCAYAPAGSVSNGNDGTAYRARALIILAVTGFVSIATQVGWTRYLAIFTGTTIYGFATILTVFLSAYARVPHSQKYRIHHGLDRDCVTVTAAGQKVCSAMAFSAVTRDTARRDSMLAAIRHIDVAISRRARTNQAQGRQWT